MLDSSINLDVVTSNRLVNIEILLSVECMHILKNFAIYGLL